MAHHWTPMETLQQVGRDEWIVFDGHKRIAVIKRLELGPEREQVYRSVTWDRESEKRVLIGYLAHLRMAAWVTWQEYAKARRDTKEPPSR